MLPYLFGIRGDAPDEEGMAPAKQEEESLIILLSLLTWEDCCTQKGVKSAQCRDGTITAPRTFSAWL